MALKLSTQLIPVLRLHQSSHVTEAQHSAYTSTQVTPVKSYDWSLALSLYQYWGYTSQVMWLKFSTQLIPVLRLHQSSHVTEAQHSAYTSTQVKPVK